MADPFSDYATVIRHLERNLLVADLKEILRECGLSIYGNKRPLIDRVHTHLARLRETKDVDRYNAVKSKILRDGLTPVSRSIPRMPLVNNSPSYPVNGNAGQYSSTAGMPYQNFAPSARPLPTWGNSQMLLNFATSPFYEIVDRLSNVTFLPYSSRNHVSMSFMLTAGSLESLNGNVGTYQVALMCADTMVSFSQKPRMEFPNPVEIMINSQKIQANLKGMKNRPGTVPPAIITPYIDRSRGLPNRADITYSSSTTHKKFGVQVVLLRTHSVDELVQEIVNGRHFSKESVLQKLRAPADDDIEMGSFDLTLKDPLSYTRITVPCRTVNCKHNQCWDAMAFLSINEQTPQWTCPICHTSIPSLDTIAIDKYFQDILDNVGNDVDTILVDPQGNWRLPGAGDGDPQVNVKTRDLSESAIEVLDLEDTDDERESKTASAIPKHLQDTPSTGSTTPVAGKITKRKVSPVCIDLTEDSDEESAPPKRVKVSESMDGQLVLPTESAKMDSESSRPPSSAHAIRTVYPYRHIPYAPPYFDRAQAQYNAELFAAYHPDARNPCHQAANSAPVSAVPDSAHLLRNGVAAPTVALPIPLQSARHPETPMDDPYGDGEDMWSGDLPSDARTERSRSIPPFVTSQNGQDGEIGPGTMQMVEEYQETMDQNTKSPTATDAVERPVDPPVFTPAEFSPPIIAPGAHSYRSSPPLIYSDDDFSDDGDF